MMCSAELTFRLPPRSRRLLRGGPSPSPEDIAMGATPHRRTNRASVLNPCGSPISVSRVITLTTSTPWMALGEEPMAFRIAGICASSWPKVVSISKWSSPTSRRSASLLRGGEQICAGVQGLAGAVERIVGAQSVAGRLCWTRLRQSTRALPANPTTWNGVHHRGRSGTSSVVAFLKPEKPPS